MAQPEVARRPLRAELWLPPMLPCLYIFLSTGGWRSLQCRRLHARSHKRWLFRGSAGAQFRPVRSCKAATLPVEKDIHRCKATQTPWRSHCWAV